MQQKNTNNDSSHSAVRLHECCSQKTTYCIDCYCRCLLLCNVHHSEFLLSHVHIFRSCLLRSNAIISLCLFLHLSNLDLSCQFMHSILKLKLSIFKHECHHIFHCCIIIILFVSSFSLTHEQLSHRCSNIISLVLVLGMTLS